MNESEAARRSSVVRVHGAPFVRCLGAPTAADRSMMSVSLFGKQLAFGGIIRPLGANPGAGIAITKIPMMSLDRNTKLRKGVLVLTLGATLTGCNSLTKLDEYKVATTPTGTDPGPVCKSNVECTE